MPPGVRGWGSAAGLLRSPPPPHRAVGSLLCSLAVPPASRGCPLPGCGMVVAPPPRAGGGCGGAARAPSADAGASGRRRAAGSRRAGRDPAGRCQAPGCRWDRAPRGPLLRYGRGARGHGGAAGAGSRCRLPVPAGLPAVFTRRHPRGTGLLGNRGRRQRSPNGCGALKALALRALAVPALTSARPAAERRGQLLPGRGRGQGLWGRPGGCSPSVGARGREPTRARLHHQAPRRRAGCPGAAWCRRTTGAWRGEPGAGAGLWTPAPQQGLAPCALAWPWSSRRGRGLRGVAVAIPAPASSPTASQRCPGGAARAALQVPALPQRGVEGTPRGPAPPAQDLLRPRGTALLALLPSLALLLAASRPVWSGQA